MGWLLTSLVVVGCRDVVLPATLPPCDPVTHDLSPITLVYTFVLVCFAERALEGYTNDVIAVTAASEIGAETTPNRGRIISGVRG